MADGKRQILIEAILKDKQARAGLAALDKDMRKLTGSQRAAYTHGKKYINAVEEQQLAQDNLTRAQGRSTKAFQGWALSIMFFGMALSRVFNGIAKSGVNTFQDVMHSVEGNVTAFDLLNNQLKYLQFVVGQALQPFIPMLIQWASWITTLVQEHPTLVRWVIGLGIALGLLLTNIGMLVLAWSGLEMMSQIIFGVKLTEKIIAAGGLVKWLGSTFTWLGGAIKAAGILGGIIIMLTYLYKLQNAMGGLGELGKSVLRGIMLGFSILGGFIAGVSAEIWNGIKFLYNTVVDTLEMIVNAAIDSLNELIRVINKIPGINISPVANVDFSKAKADVKDFGKSFIDAYGAIVQGWQDIMPDWMKPDKGYASGLNIIPQYEAEQTQPNAFPEAPQTNNVYFEVVMNNQSTDSANEILEEFQRRASSLGLNITGGN